MYYCSCLGMLVLLHHDVLALLHEEVGTVHAIGVTAACPVVSCRVVSCGCSLLAHELSWPP